MTKYLRPILSVFLCVCLLTAVLPAAFAVSADEGEGALRSQWKRGEGPSVAGYSLDYSYFEPEAAKRAALPLFVFMAGVGEGTSPGKELTANSFCLWSSEEYQARVANAPGAYLLILRAPEPVYFDTCPTASVHAAVSDFAEKHNVDENRIYVLGWCVGANGAVRLVQEHPDCYAGLVAFSMRRSLSDADVAALKNTAVWLLGCTNDSYSVYGMYTSPAWSNLKAGAADKARVRLTSCTAAPDAGMLFNHHMWLLGEQDYAPATSRYTNLKTVDGAGRTVENPDFIHWLSSQYLRTQGAAPSEEAPKCTCDCHSSNVFTKIVWFFKTLVWRLTGNEARRVCECGKRHW